MTLIARLLGAMWTHLRLLGGTDDASGLLRGMHCSLKALFWMLTIQPCVVLTKPWRVNGAYPAAWMILSAVMLTTQFVGTCIGGLDYDVITYIQNCRSLALYPSEEDFTLVVSLNEYILRGDAVGTSCTYVDLRV
jgi:hypothetical protein